MPLSFRWWYLPSWMGLDAPCVVSTWTWAISVSTGLQLSWLSLSAMFLVVWSIYLTDRLIDVHRCHDWQSATGRLRFGRKYRPIFVVCLGLCVSAIVVVTAFGLPREVYIRSSLVACGVVTHFMLFAVPVFFRDKLPGKELGVGLFFALGAYACLGAKRTNLPLFVALGLVVAANCLVIAARDAVHDRINDPGGASHWWRTMRRDLRWIGLGLAVSFAIGSAIAEEKAFYVAAASSSGLLTLLCCLEDAIDGDALRALADFALLTPIPVTAMFLIL